MLACASWRFNGPMLDSAGGLGIQSMVNIIISL